jgi:hypothetical protein
MTKPLFEDYLDTLDRNEFIELLCTDSHFLNEMLITEGQKLYKVVIMPGEFQPFHRGDFEIYRQLAATFGEGKVYIAVGAKVDPVTAPMDFEEKIQLAAKAFNIRASKMVYTQNPYKPAEILQNFDSKTTVLLLAISRAELPFVEKDDYYKEYFTYEKHRSYSEEGYYFVYDDPNTTDLEGHKITAQRVQNILQNPNIDDKRKRDYLDDVLGTHLDDDAYGMLMTKFNAKLIDPEADVSTQAAVGTQPSPKKKPKVDASPEDQKSKYRHLLYNRVHNPITGHDILVKSALQYDKTHPVYQAARSYVLNQIQQAG